MAQPSLPYVPPGVSAPTSTPGAELPPRDLSTIRTMLTLGQVFAVLALVVEVLAAVGSFLANPVGAIGWLVAFVFSVVIVIMVQGVRSETDAGRYRAAKSRLLPWMVLGFFFALFLGGIFLLIAYVKYDEVATQPTPYYGAVSAPTGVYSGVPGAPVAAPGAGGQMMYNPYTAQVAPSPMPVAGTAAPGPIPTSSNTAPPAPTCPRCGRPATWIPQYNRWYCYPDQSYL